MCWVELHWRIFRHGLHETRRGLNENLSRLARAFRVATEA